MTYLYLCHLIKFLRRAYSIPYLGTINFYAKKLPFYRGRNILNWVLINDQKEFGITVHYINEGIDTGDVILQKTFPINDQDNYKTPLDKAYIECPNILLEEITNFKKYKLLSTQQKQLSASFMYYSKRIEGDEIINWNTTSREILNFVRALTLLGQCATTYYKNYPIKILEFIEIFEAPKYIGVPGCILEIDKDYFIVKTIDLYIKIIK